MNRYMHFIYMDPQEIFCILNRESLLLCYDLQNFGEDSGAPIYAAIFVH